MSKSLVLGVLALACLACHGDDGPTASPSIPNLAGSWVGDWTVEGVVIPTRLNLSQSGSRLSGTFASLGSSFPITGSVNSSLQMQWSVDTGGCGSLAGNGTADSLSPAQMTGTTDFNTLGCSSNRRFVGPVIWRRSSGLKGPSSISGSATFERLAESLQQEIH